MKTTIAILLLALSSPLMAGGFVIRPHSPRTVVFSQYFDLYDTDGDGILSFAEFQGSIGASDIPVVTEFRFIFMADFLKSAAESESSPVEGLFINRYIRYAGGLKVPKPNKFIRFDLADDNNDGFLSMAEYAQTRNAAAATDGSLGKSFNKLDKNDDNQISPAEFGINKA